MYATVLCEFAGIDEGAVVQVVALAIAGTGRSLVQAEGKFIRVPNEAFLAINT